MSHTCMYPIMYGIHVYIYMDVTHGDHGLDAPLPRDISMTFIARKRPHIHTPLSAIH